jgi:uridine kinase
VDRSSVIKRATPDAVLIVDGVFAFSPEISEDRNFRIWLDVPPETSALPLANSVKKPAH